MRGEWKGVGCMELVRKMYDVSVSGWVTNYAYICKPEDVFSLLESRIVNFFFIGCPSVGNTCVCLKAMARKVFTNWK